MQSMVALQVLSYFNATHNSITETSQSSIVHLSKYSNKYLAICTCKLLSKTELAWTVFSGNYFPENTVRANSVTAFYNYK